MTKFSYFVLFLTLLFQIGFCEEEQKIIPEGYKVTYILPINWTTDHRYNLSVTIPEGYRALQTQSDWLKKEFPMIEFIPLHESDDNWSEIITVNKYIGQALSAESLVKNLKNVMLSKVQNGKVWKDALTKETSYIFSNLGLTYDLNGKHEVFGARYYSGPYDTVGLQITIRPQKGQTDAEVMKKIEKFFEDNTQVIESKAEQKAVAKSL